MAVDTILLLLFLLIDSIVYIRQIFNQNGSDGRCAVTHVPMVVTLHALLLLHARMLLRRIVEPFIRLLYRRYRVIRLLLVISNEAETSTLFQIRFGSFDGRGAVEVMVSMLQM